MTRDELLSLPTPLALRVLLDCLDPGTARAIEAKEVPKVPRAPKYDRQIYRSNGFQWASETSLEGLRFWRKRAVESAERNEQSEERKQWAAKDQKQAAELGRWIEWRECFPDAPWSGKRGESDVVAAPSADKPRVHQRPSNGQQRKAAPPPEDDSFDPETW